MKADQNQSTLDSGAEKSVLENVARNLATYTAAYFLDVADALEPAIRLRIDGLDSRVGPDWPATVERLYGFDRTFARHLYVISLDHFLPHEAVAFVLRGLDVPNPVALMQGILNLELPSHDAGSAAEREGVRCDASHDTVPRRPKFAPQTEDVHR